jgi:TraM recognition site of TraD and TraG
MGVKPLMDIIIGLVILIIVLGVVGMVVLGVLFPIISKPPATRQALEKAPPLPTLSQIEPLQKGNFVQVGTTNDKKGSIPYILTEDVRKLNVLNLGPIGAGKTKYMLSTCIQKDIATPGNAVVIYDPQRDLTNDIVSLCFRYGREVTIFPDAGFNPLAGSGSTTNRARLFADLYAQLSKSGQQGGGIFYSELAQTFILLVIPLFEAAYQKPMTLQELLSVAENKGFRQRLMNDAPPGYEKMSYQSAFGSWKDQKFEDNLTGIPIFIRRIVAEEPLNNLLNQRNAPTLEQCIERRQVIIIRAGGYPNTIGATVGLLFQVSLQSFIERRNTDVSNHFISIYMDELPMYLNENFKTLVATSRKQKVSLFMGFQQIKQLYPYEDVITGNTKTWFVHNGLGGEETEYIAKTIGEREYMVYSSSIPRDVRQSPSDTQSPSFGHIITPTEVRNIPQEQVLMLSVKPLRDREVDHPRFLIKPTLNELQAAIAQRPYSYAAPAISPYPPPHVWV